MISNGMHGMVTLRIMTTEKGIGIPSQPPHNATCRLTLVYQAKQLFRIIQTILLHVYF